MAERRLTIFANKLHVGGEQNEPTIRGICDNTAQQCDGMWHKGSAIHPICNRWARII